MSVLEPDEQDIQEQTSDEMQSGGSEQPSEVTDDQASGMDEAVPAEQLLAQNDAPAAETDETRLKAVIEAVIYIADEPLTAEQIAQALGQPRSGIEAILARLVAEYDQPDRGLTVRQVAGGYKMATKPEHHEQVRQFVKNLKPPFKLSLAALETLAVIAYKQPITAPEILEIRGVQGAGVLKTLLDRKLITTSGRKNVVGKPILYRTTKDFLVQFGLKDLNELPSLKEFEELRRLAVDDVEAVPTVEGDVTAPEAAPVEPATDETSADSIAPQPEESSEGEIPKSGGQQE